MTSTTPTQVQSFQEANSSHTQTQLHLLIGIKLLFNSKLTSMMMMIPLKVPERWPLKCKLKWMLQSLLLTKEELNNKLNSRTTWTKTTQLLNFKVWWTLNNLWREWPLLSVLNQIPKRLKVWPKSLVSQWPQNWCNSETTKPSPTPLLRLLLVWVRPRLKSLLLWIEDDVKVCDSLQMNLNLPIYLSLN